MTDLRNYNSLYKAYTELLIQKEKLNKEMMRLRFRYLVIFGELKNEAVRNRETGKILLKKINYCKRMVQQALPITEKNMDMALEKDILKSWRIIQLGEISYSEACAAFSDTAAQVRDHDPEEVQGAFDTLLEILSPDLHPDLQRNKDALSLWAAVVRAYVLNDLDYLKIVASFKADLVQVFNLLNEPVLSDLEKRIDELKKRINGYSDCEEFGFSSILADPRRIEEEKKRLTTQIQYFADSILEFEQKLDSFPILRMLS